MVGCAGGDEAEEGKGWGSAIFNRMVRECLIVMFEHQGLNCSEYRTSGQQEQSVQRSWGRTMTGMLEEHQGDPCEWSRVSKGRQ